MGTQDRGFASMDADKQKEIASEGGKASHGSNNQKMSRSEAGKMGAKAQPTEAKAEGGRNSHRNN